MASAQVLLAPTPFCRGTQMMNKTREEDTQGRRQSKRRIVVVVAPPVEELDLVAPMQVLGAANRLSGKRVYSIEIVTLPESARGNGASAAARFLRRRLHARVTP